MLGLNSTCQLGARFAKNAKMKEAVVNTNCQGQKRETQNHAGISDERQQPHLGVMPDVVMLRVKEFLDVDGPGAGISAPPVKGPPGPLVSMCSAGSFIVLQPYRYCFRKKFLVARRCREIGTRRLHT